MADTSPDSAAPRGQIRHERDGAIALITISRPEKHNAVSLEMWEQLRDTFLAVAVDPEIRVVILRGEGRAAFSAGADISEFSSVRATVEEATRYSDLIEAAERAIIQLGKPAIAMLYGMCHGGGSGIALACSLRFADEAFRFSIPAAKLGVVYHQTAVVRLVQHVGPSTALDLLASAREMDAEEANRRGLLDGVHASDELEERVFAYARQVAERAPVAVAGASVGVQVALRPDDEELRRELTRLQVAATASQDYQEGVRAFLEKRPPVFRAR